jgi:hypothetical protein
MAEREGFHASQCAYMNTSPRRATPYQQAIRKSSIAMNEPNSLNYLPSLYFTIDLFCSLVF